MKKVKKVYELIYIHASKVQTQEGFTLAIYSMDAKSTFAFHPVFSKTTEVSLSVLEELFDNILKDYKPIFNPRIITFVTNLSSDYEPLIKETKASNHKFIFNKEATENAITPLLNAISHTSSPL